LMKLNKTGGRRPVWWQHALYLSYEMEITKAVCS